MEETFRINTYAEEDEAIKSRFGRLFDSAIIPVQYGNIGLLKNGNKMLNDPDNCEQYVRFDIEGGPGSEPEITRTFSRNTGIISISIFTKHNLGSRKGKAVADMIFPIFSRVSFNGIRTGSPTLVEVPPNQGWYQMNMTIIYTWDRCLA